MNVVIICLDTFRADFLGARGLNPTIETPNLDRLAAEGVLFENAFGEGQPTIQYRRALCTGMRSFPYVRNYDTVGLSPRIPGWHKIPPEQPTLAETLLARGYVTGLVADTYHMFKPTQNFTRGFASWDFIRGQEADPWRTGPLGNIDLTRYAQKDSLTTAEADKSVDVLVQWLLNNQDRRSEMDYLPARVFSSAIRFLEDNKDNAPFFLWIDSFDPHEPWDPPTEYADAYDPDWNGDWEPIFYTENEAPEDVKRRVKALYSGECTFVDKQVGRFLDALDASGLADDTFVLVCSDHGCEFWEHGGIVKEHNKNRYRHNSETLCLMRFPGKEHAGKRVDGFVLNQDFFPTVLSLLDVKHPPVDGVDLLPLIRGEVGSVRDDVVTGWSGSNRRSRAAVRNHQYCYSCAYLEEDLDELLFDVQADPGETRNVASERPEVAAACRARVEETVGETLPAQRLGPSFPFVMPAGRLMKRPDWQKKLLP